MTTVDDSAFPGDVVAMVGEARREGRRVVPVRRRANGHVVGIAVHVDRRQSVLAARLERAGFVARAADDAYYAGTWWVWRRPGATS